MMTSVTSDLRVVEIDPQADPRWKALVAAIPQGLIYHHPAWLQVLEEAFGYQSVSLACENASGHLLGILPLFSLHGFVTGQRFSSLPRTPVAGPLAVNDQARTALLNAAVARVRETPKAHLQLKAMAPGLEESIDGLVGAPWREVYQLKLPSDPTLLHLGNTRNWSRIKWAVNKAARLGVRVRPATTEDDLRAWYPLYLETMRQHFIPPRPYRFFEVTWRRLAPGGMMQVLLAEDNEAGRPRLLAGSIFFMFGQTVFYAFNGRRQDALALRPNEALQWQAIQHACAAGYRYYDLGEVSGGQHSLAAFKRKWGAQPTWLYRYYYPAPEEREISLLESNSHVTQSARVLWQRLPLKATALLGDWAHHYF